MAATSAFVFTHARRESEAEKLHALRRLLLARGGRLRSATAAGPGGEPYAGDPTREQADLAAAASLLGWRGGRGGRRAGVGGGWGWGRAPEGTRGLRVRTSSRLQTRPPLCPAPRPAAHAAAHTAR